MINLHACKGQAICSSIFFDIVQTSEGSLNVLSPPLECGPHTFGVVYFMLNWCLGLFRLLM